MRVCMSLDRQIDTKEGIALIVEQVETTVRRCQRLGKLTLVPHAQQARFMTNVKILRMLRAALIEMLDQVFRGHKRVKVVFVENYDCEEQLKHKLGNAWKGI